MKIRSEKTKIKNMENIEDSVKKAENGINSIEEQVVVETNNEEVKSEISSIEETDNADEKAETEINNPEKKPEGGEDASDNREDVKESSAEKEDDANKGDSIEKEGGAKQPEEGEEKPEESSDKKENVNDGDISTKKTGKKAKKKVLIFTGILFILIAVCCCTYIAIGYTYKEKFLPGTWVNGIDCSEMTGAQVAGLLHEQLQTYYLDIRGRDYTGGDTETLLGQVTAGDISLTYSGNNNEAVKELLEDQNVFTWLYRKVTDDTYSFHLFQGVSYDEEQLKSIVNSWEMCRPDNMTAPQDAYISDYSEKINGYEIIPEVEGTKFDIQMLLELIDTAILSQENILDLEAAGCYEEPAVRQDAAELTEPVETANKWLASQITYDWNDTEIIVDAELLKDWITMEKDGPVLDETAVAAFVKAQAKEYDTYGKTRSFTTVLGVTLNLRSGYYGWLTDQEAETAELIEAIYQGKTVSKEPVYASAARQKGMSDIGNSYVEVDLTHQHLYLYEEGTIILETDFVSGNMTSDPGCVTPEGVFGISYKTTNAVLRGANYETPVSYWMPFYGNYGLHDATWRSEFGGQIYITNGSHGCVNLPLSSAAAIYEHVSAGFPVICYYYQVDPLADQQVNDADNGMEYYDDSEDEE